MEIEVYWNLSDTTSPPLRPPLKPKEEEMVKSESWIFYVSDGVSWIHTTVVDAF